MFFHVVVNVFSCVFFFFYLPLSTLLILPYRTWPFLSSLYSALLFALCVLIYRCYVSGKKKGEAQYVILDVT